MTVNFIGPNNGEGLRVYHDGKLVANINRKWKYRLSSVDGRIVIGGLGIGFGNRYTSLHVDDLVFFNQPLSEEEIVMLNQ